MMIVLLYMMSLGGKNSDAQGTRVQDDSKSVPGPSVSPSLEHRNRLNGRDFMSRLN
jgi:hypothetical protein